MPNRLTRYFRQGGKNTVIAVSLVFVMIATLVAGLIGPQIVAERKLDVELTASPSRESKLQLLAPDGGISPACGCLYPNASQLRWYGLIVPSHGFTMDLDVLGETSEKTWILMSRSPDVDELNWYGYAHDTSEIVISGANGEDVRFQGTGTHLTIVTDTAVAIEHGEEYPALAVLPGFEGSTSFLSEPGPRPNEGSFGLLKVGNPERTERSDELIKDGTPDTVPTAVKLRGPMFDLLGPKVEYNFQATSATRVLVGAKRIKNIAVGEWIKISQRVPFAARLAAQPANGEYGKMLVSDEWTTTGDLSKSNAEGDLTNSTSAPRFLDVAPLPAYEVTLSKLQIPDSNTWQKFADRSGPVDRMIPPEPTDGSFAASSFGLPPVHLPQSVVAYGQVSSLSTDAHSGTLTIGTEQIAVALGSTLSIESPSGLKTTRFGGQPIFSSGGDAPKFNLTGEAKVLIGGKIITHPIWAQYTQNMILFWLSGGIAIIWASVRLVGKLLRINNSTQENTT